jgi:methionyl-tRNA formyltransferase
MADGKLRVGCGEGALVLDEVQPDGGRRMCAHEFARGHELVSFEVRSP